MLRFRSAQSLSLLLLLAFSCSEPDVVEAARSPAAQLEVAQIEKARSQIAEPELEPEAPASSAEPVAQPEAGEVSAAEPEEAHVETILDSEDSPLMLRVTERRTGDLDAINERELLRVLVSYSRTNFFMAKGKLRGFEYEMFRELQEHLEEITPKGSPPPIVAFLPVPFEELLPALLEGRGDIAASALTVTPARSARVAFSDPYLEDVDEVLVAHKGAPKVESWAELAGQAVYVTKGSSYAEHLTQVNEVLQRDGHEPIVVHTTGRGIGTEDLLEMVSSGALEYTIADRYLAELWAEVLSGLRVNAELTTGESGHLAWALRPGNPKLKAMLDDFVAKNRKGTLIGNVLFKRYYGKTDWLRNPLFDVANSKLEPFLPALKKYSAEYDFDWRLIAAQAYQESGLDPEALSRSGAVGLMQLLPSTAADMGVSELRDPSENLRAGVKYMDWLRKHFINDPRLDPAVAVDFALASYNAGPSNVKRWRAAAPERGLDPDRWFGNVELIALEHVGMQPVQYVSNINKYYVIYTLTLDEMLAREKAQKDLIEASSR